jgi:hypothetical protein
LLIYKKGVKMIVCHVCGTENPDGSKFCEGCGVELQAPVALNVGAIAPVAEAVVPVVEAAVAPVAEAVAPVEEAVAPVAEAVEAVIPGLSAIPEIAPPPLPSDESALDIEATPPAVEVPALEAPVLEVPVLEVPVVEATPLETAIPAAVAPVAAILGSTLDGTVNPKATIETPILNIPKVAKLLARGSGGEGHVLHSERMVVGRFDPSAGPVDIDLSGGQGENYISRRHAEVFLENGVWMVRDLGSTNGVYVKRAGQAQYSPRIIEPQALSDGDEVAFGNMKFLFVMSEGA